MALNAGDEASTQESLKLLLEVAELDPRFILYLLFSPASPSCAFPHQVLSMALNAGDEASAQESLKLLLEVGGAGAAVHSVPAVLPCFPLLCLPSSGPEHGFERGDEASAQESLKLLLEVAELEPRFMRRRLVDVVAGMLGIAETASLEDDTRHLAIEFLISLAEARGARGRDDAQGYSAPRAPPLPGTDEPSRPTLPCTLLHPLHGLWHGRTRIHGLPSRKVCRCLR